MKKKKKYKNQISTKFSWKNLVDLTLIKNKIIQNKTILLLFLISFTFTLITIYSSSNRDPISKGGDASYYYVSALKVKEHIIKSPFSFAINILFNNFNQNEYAKMGFLENDIESIYRAPAFIGIWGFLFWIFGNSYTIIFIFNSLFFALSTILIYIVANYIFKNKKISIILSIIYMAYMPFHNLTLYMLTENIIIPSILLMTLFYLKSINEKRKKDFFILGFLIYLSSLLKVSIQYLGIFLIFYILFYIFKTFKEKELKKKYIISFICGILIIMLPWKFISFRASGEFNLINVTNAKVSKVSAGRVGWAGFALVFEGYNSIIGRAHTKYFRDSINDVPKIKNTWFYYSYICGEAIKKAFKDKPFEVFKNTIKKATYLLISPIFENAHYSRQKNYPFHKFFMGLPNFIYHNIIILLTLFAIIFPFINFKNKLIFILIIFYHLSIHGLSSVESRYNSTAIPSYILLSGYTLLWIKNNYLKLLKILMKKKYIIIGSSIVLSIFIYKYITISIIQSIFPAFSVAGSFVIHIILFNIILLLLTFYLYNISRFFINKKEMIISSILFYFFLFIPYHIFALSNRDYDKWETILSKKGESIRQEITLPDNFNLNDYDEAVLAIDTKSKDNGFKLRIKINDKLIKEYKNGITLQSNILYYNSGSKFKSYENKWVFLKFDMGIIKNKNVKIEIIPFFTDNSKNELIISGDYKKSNPYFIGNSFFLDYRVHYKVTMPFLKERFETRFVRKYKVNSRTRSIYIKNNIEKTNDLSARSGMQSGEYRIRLLLKRKGGYYIDQKYSILAKYYYGFVGLFRPLENGLVKWISKPDKNMIPAPDNVRQYLQTEYDRYYTGYDIY